MITRSPGLAAALLRGMPLRVIGRRPLRDGLAQLLVLARSSGPSVSIAATLLPEPGPWLALAPFGLGPFAGGRLAPAVASRFPTRSRGRGLYVLDSAGDEAFVLAPGSIGQPVLFAGSWPMLVPLVGPRLPALAAGGEEALESVLALFCQVLEVMVAAAPGRQSVDLELAPSDLAVDAVLGALGPLARVRRRPPTGREHHEDAADEPVGLQDVGGQDAAKDQLSAIVQAVRDPESFRRWGARPPRGALLYGPPGTGKTLLARAVARESGAAFLHVRVTDVTSKWYGEAEQKLQQAFDWARGAAPAVLFFDELDALARSRDDAHEVTHRLVTTFLENMDGLERVEGVVVLAATNRPEAVDPALTRPGRFDRLVEVPLPGRDARRRIFEVHLAAATRRARRPVFEPPSEADWDRLLAASEGQSGADIAEAVRRSLEAKVRAAAGGGQVAPDELLVEVSGVGRPW